MLLKPWQWRQYKTGSISLCMIMKNEEKRLARCLESVKGLCDEIIITDTGSTDYSVDIAKSYNATVLHKPWCDDFSAVRNHGIERASCDWILILDPDEVISLKDHAYFRRIAADYRYHAYRLHTRNYTHDLRQQGALHNPGDYAEGAGFPGFVLSTKARFFLRAAGLRFRGVWHELLDWDIEAKKAPVATVEIPVHHFPGEITQASYKEKAAFYNRLGLKKVKEWPYNPQAWHELFVSYMVLQNYRSAAYCAAKALKYGIPVAGRMFSQARALNELGAKDLGNLAFEKGVCLLYPNLTHSDPQKRTLDDLKI